jgi:hypothetical protein
MNSTTSSDVLHSRAHPAWGKKLLLLMVLLVLVAASGCGATPPAWFRLNMVEATKQ